MYKRTSIDDKRMEKKTLLTLNFIIGSIHTCILYCSYLVHLFVMFFKSFHGSKMCRIYCLKIHSRIPKQYEN